MSIITNPNQITIPEMGCVTSAYNGRIGCACGCLGNHTESPRSKTITRNKLIKLLQLAKEDPKLPVTWMATSDFVSADNLETGRTHTLYIG